jgi:hypothetical protein
LLANPCSYGCTASELEAKYGNFNTPACNEFSPKILGAKATIIILDDAIKEKGLI